MPARPSHAYLKRERLSGGRISGASSLEPLGDRECLGAGEETRLGMGDGR